MENIDQKNEESKEEIITNEDVLGPPKVDLTYVGLIALGSIIAGFIGGIIIVVSIYIFLSKMKGFEGAYPIIYSLTGFFAALTTSFITLMMQQFIAGDKYKKGVATFTQVGIYLIFLFIFFAPSYLYVANVSRTDLLPLIFTIHIILSILGTSIISEVISSYRYVLLGIYGTFIGFFISILFSIFIFMNFTGGRSALFALIGIIILMNFTVNTIRALFEYIYYMIYKISGTDYLGDIFSKIEYEEKEIEEKAREQLEKF